GASAQRLRLQISRSAVSASEQQIPRCARNDNLFAQDDRSNRNLTKNRAPHPGSLSAQIFPPNCSTSRRLIARPSPAPPCCRVVARGDDHAARLGEPAHGL